MPQYIFVYRALRGEPPAPSEEIFASWSGWFDSHGRTVVEPGLPVFERTAVGEVGASTDLGGYSVVTADDLAAAIALARTSPALKYGGGVEVGVLAELPPEHGASRLKEERAARA